jgi:hypothetical protein
MAVDQPQAASTEAVTAGQAAPAEDVEHTVAALEQAALAAHLVPVITPMYFLGSEAVWRRILAVTAQEGVVAVMVPQVPQGANRAVLTQAPVAPRARLDIRQQHFTAAAVGALVAEAPLAVTVAPAL